MALLHQGDVDADQARTDSRLAVRRNPGSTVRTLQPSRRSGPTGFYDPDGEVGIETHLLKTAERTERCRYP